MEIITVWEISQHKIILISIIISEKKNISAKSDTIIIIQYKTEENTFTTTKGIIKTSLLISLSLIKESFWAYLNLHNYISHFVPLWIQISILFTNYLSHFLWTTIFKQSVFFFTINSCKNITKLEENSIGENTINYNKHYILYILISHMFSPLCCLFIPLSHRVIYKCILLFDAFFCCVKLRAYTRMLCVLLHLWKCSLARWETQCELLFVLAKA